MRASCLRTFLSAALCVCASSALEAQTVPFAQRPFDSQVLRPSGQPVIPVYDGWFQNPDGTYTLCFSYFNLNTEQSLDIPLGPGNRVTPAEFDGRQPTHFDPVPNPDPKLTGKYRHHWCVFTIQVPADFGDRRVEWTLATRTDTLKVPGYLNKAYVLEELRSSGRNVVAPVVRFEPNGPQGQGRGGMVAGPYTVAVGKPLAVSARVEPDKQERRTWVGWTKHQGPGEVTFDQGEGAIKGTATVTATARFSEPGEYMLRLQAVNNPRNDADPTGSFEFHCCWTNGYVRVTVTP